MVKYCLNIYNQIIQGSGHLHFKHQGIFMKVGSIFLLFDKIFFIQVVFNFLNKYLNLLKYGTP